MENSFSSRRWTNWICWRSGNENIHLETGSPNSRRKSPWFSWRIRRVSSTTSRLTSGCPWSDKWLSGSMSGNFIYLHHVELYWPREESFPIPLESLPNYHEDHIAGRRTINSLQHYNLVHKFVQSEAIRIPAAKAAVDKEWEKLEKISALNLTIVKSKSEVIEDARTSGATVHFASLMDICHLKNAELETKAPEIQRSSCTSTRHGERRFWRLCSIHGTRIISFSNDSSKCHGYHFQTARLRWTSSGRSISLNPSENGWCSQIIENSKIEVSRHWDSSTTTQMAKIMVQHRRPSCCSWAKTVRSFLAGLLWERQFERILLKYGWEKVSNCECLFVHREKGLFLTVYVDDIKLAGKKQNIHPMWWVRNNRSRFWKNQHLSLIIYTWCTLKDNVKEAKILWTITEPCLNHEFPREELKNYHTLKIFVFLRGPNMEGHAKKCVERYCAVGKQDDETINSTKYLFLASMTITLRKKK